MMLGDILLAGTYLHCGWSPLKLHWYLKWNTRLHARTAGKKSRWSSISRCGAKLTSKTAKSAAIRLRSAIPWRMTLSLISAQRLLNKLG
jgi:hypothetical protein